MGTYGVGGFGEMSTRLITNMSSSVEPQYFKGLCPGTGSPTPGTPSGDWPQSCPIVAAEAVVDRAARKTVKYFIVAVERSTNRDESESLDCGEL